MAQHYSPRIVTDSLVMCLDPSQNRSYPTTDLPVKNGLLVWLDASDDTTFSYSSGTEVSQWRDKSGNNFHANQSTTAVQPTRNTTNNSRKSVNFVSATGDNLIISSGISLPNDVSIFILYKPATQSYQYAVLIDNYHGQGGNYGFVIQRVSTNTQFYYANGNGSGFIDTSASPWNYTDNVIQLLSLNKSGTTGTPYTSGTAQTSRTVYANTAQYTTGLAIGTWGYGGGRFYNGDICEILIFNRALTATEMKQVHTYLGQKWGISNADKSIVDLTTNNYSGLLGNGTTTNMPFFDYYNKGSLKFDGNNDYITTGVSGIVPTSTAPYTVSAWCYRNANTSSYKEILAQWTNANSGNSFFFGFNNSNVRFTDNWNDVVVSGAGNTNVWMNLVGVYTVSNAYIYLNGSLAATKGSGFTYTGTGPLIIGRQGELNGEYFDGNIGNILIYNKALSATEVLQNYEAQKSRFANTIVQQGLVLNLDAGNPYSYAGAGTTWYDVSGNNYSGSLTNGPVYSTTNSGIIVFDGSNDYVDLTSNTFSISGNASRSMFAWVKTTYNGNQAFIATGTPAGSQAFILVKYGSYVGVMGYNNDFYPSSGRAIADGIWHYVGATFDGTNLRTYVDGVLDNTSGTITYSTTGQNNYVGRSNHAGNENFINGSMGNAQIYNRALTAAEVLQNYNATKDRFGL